MARRKQRNVEVQTAEHTQAEVVEQPQSTDFFDGFAGSTVALILNVTRTEPVTHAGFLGQLNLASDQEHLVPAMIQEKWGGGLFTVQVYQRSPNGKNKFGPAKRLQIAGEPRHPVVQVAVAPAPAPQALPAPTALPSPNAANVPPGYYPPPGYPWPYPPNYGHLPPAPPTQAPADPMAMFKTALELAQRAPTTTAQDLAAVIERLNSNVVQKPAQEDPFTQIEKTIKLTQLLRSMSPRAQTPQASSGEEQTGLASILEIVKGLLGGQQAQANPTLRVPPPPPGYAFDTRLGRYVALPGHVQASPPQPSASGGGSWENMSGKSENAADEDDDEGDEEDDEPDEPDEPYNAEEALEQFQAMRPDQQLRLLQMIQGLDPSTLVAG